MFNLERLFEVNRLNVLYNKGKLAFMKMAFFAISRRETSFPTSSLGWINSHQQQQLVIGAVFICALSETCWWKFDTMFYSHLLRSFDISTRITQHTEEKFNILSSKAKSWIEIMNTTQPCRWRRTFVASCRALLHCHSLSFSNRRRRKIVIHINWRRFEKVFLFDRLQDEILIQT